MPVPRELGTCTGSVLPLEVRTSGDLPSRPWFARGTSFLPSSIIIVFIMFVVFVVFTIPPVYVQSVLTFLSVLVIPFWPQIAYSVDIRSTGVGRFIGDRRRAGLSLPGFKEGRAQKAIHYIASLGTGSRDKILKGIFLWSLFSTRKWQGLFSNLRWMAWWGIELFWDRDIS